MNRFASLFAVVALAVLAAAASAQVPQTVAYDPDVAYGGGAGVAFPLGDAEEVLDRGFAVHGFVRFKISDNLLMPRLDLEYQKFDFKAGGGTSSVLAGSVNVQLFLTGGTLRPYAVGGLGAYRVGYDIDGVGDDSSTRFGLNGGGGVSFRVGPRLNIYSEIRLVNIISDEGPVDSDFQTVPFTVGIVY